MAGLHFDITGDNSNFIRKLHECENGVRNTSKQIEQSGLSIEDLFNRMTKAAAAFGAGFTAKELISNIAQVRGEFQQLEVAFKTMLGSEEKANALMQQLVKTAAATPFDLQGVANGAKQLLAYGENVENVNDDLIRLGNIAAGLSQPLGDIVYLYGTTMTQGRLYTQDLNQFTGRGIPMIRELAKQFNVAENKVKGLVEAGKVGFPEVQKVIMSLTNEGGMFYNLMQEQSKTITGQISNIEDAIATMFNEIGKANEGIINDALSGVSYLVENYEKVGRVLLEIVGTYGAYRTALMVTSSLQALQASGITALTAKEAAHYGWLVLTKKAQDALNLSMLKNPYVLAAAAVAGLAYGIYKLATAETETERAVRKTNEALEAQENHYESIKNKASELSNTLSNESKSIEERFIAYRQLQRLMPEVFQNMDWETAKRKTNAELIKLETDELLRQQRIGLKTKVVMSQQKIQGLENSIIKTDNRGGYTGALKEDLSAARKELEIYTKALEDFEKADEQAKKESEKPVIFNKKYWEGQKKEAEDALNSIASSQKKLLDAGKFEGIDASVIKSYKDNTKKLKEAEKELKVYDSSSKRKSAANKQKKEQQKTAEELLSLRRQNQQAEINLMKEGTEKKLKQIDIDYQKELDAIKKQEKELSERQGGKLTSEQSIEISARYTNAERKREKGISDTTREQLEAQKDAWNEYYIEYGKYQEKRMAIMEKYDKQIAKAEEGSAEKAALTAQRKKELDDLDKELLDSSELWSKFFTDFSNRSSSSIRSIIEDIQELIDYMNGVEGAQIPDIFKDNEKAVKAINDAMSNPSALKKFTSNLESSIKKFKKMLDEDNPFKQISEGFKTKDSKGISKGFQGIASAAKELTGILEELGVESDSTAGKVTSVLGNTASYAATGASVGGPWGAIIGGAIGMATGLVGVLGADYSAYNKMKDEYASLIDVWDILINKKKEYVNISYGDEARKAGEEAIDLIGKKLQSNIELGIERLNSGASAGSHSIGVRIRKSMSNEGWRQWDEFAQSIGIDPDSIGGRLTGLFGLTAEQLSKLQEDAPTFWAKLDDDVKGYLQDIIDCNEEIENMKEQLKETMTGVSFDSFYDNFVSTLSDMDKDSQDFADDFENYLKNAILSNLVANKYRSKIEALYNDWANKSDSNGDGIFDLTSSEADELRKAQQALAEEMIAERDAMAEVFGWTSSASSQESSKKGFGTEMTHEDAGELRGRFTALQIAGEEIKNQMIAVVMGINSLTSISSVGNEVLNNILTQHVITNSYLDDIAKYTKLLNDIKTDISEVRINTKGLSTR